MRKFKKELDISVKDSEDPIRYIIVSDLLPKSKWQLYFNVSDETWCSEIGNKNIADLLEGDVLINVKYSSLNYKGVFSANRKIGGCPYLFN